MKKVLIALLLVAVMAFGAGVASAADKTGDVTITSVTTDPGGGVKP